MEIYKSSDGNKRKEVRGNPLNPAINYYAGGRI